MGLSKRGKVWWMSFTHKRKVVRISTKVKDKRLAEKIYNKVMTQVAEGRWFDKLQGEDKTFKEMMERYMEEHSKIKKKSWGRDIQSLAHLMPFFGEYVLEEITPGLISKYKGLRYREGAAPATINREVALMKHAFNLSIKEWEWCRENPVTRVKMERENNARDRWLSYREEKKLLEVSPLWLCNIVVFALQTGMRQSEILDLVWQDIDLERLVVVVKQGKTGQMKSIPLTVRAVDVLNVQNKRGGRFAKSLVFPSESGTRITASNLGRAFRKACKRAEVENFRFHDLRHTFATRLAQSSVDIYLIQRLLGHKDPKMVQRYAHHSVESLRRGIEVLERDLTQFWHNLGSNRGSGSETEKPVDKKQCKILYLPIRPRSSGG